MELQQQTKGDYNVNYEGMKDCRKLSETADMYNRLHDCMSLRGNAEDSTYGSL